MSFSHPLTFAPSLTAQTTGINYSFAVLLLSRNCNVVIADLSLRPEAEEFIAKHNDSSKSPRAIFVKTDVTSWPDLEKMFTTAFSEFGDVEILCPGAGVYEPHWSNFWHPPGGAESKDPVDSGHYALLDINLNHPIRATQLAISHWLHPPAGSAQRVKVSQAAPRRIVHIVSVAGYVPVFSAPLYAASKYGLTGFVRSLARLDEKHGIRVNAVAPGIVRTPLWLEHPEKMVYLDTEQDGWVTPDEVAVAMLRMVEADELVGGTILEVGKEHTRLVKNHNDEGPSQDPARGMVASNAEDGCKMVYNWLDDEKVWGSGKTVN